MWLLLLLLTLLPTAHYRHHGPAILPDSLATPGIAVTSDTALICRRGYATTARNADTALYRKLRGPIYRAYGVGPHDPVGHQFDHLIPVELGGATARGNLWPEPGAIRFGWQSKDRLENRLRRLVCAGKLPIVAAQQAIARDWYATAIRYP